MNARWIVAALALLAFGVYTDIVVFQEGYFGFVELALRERWAMQMLLDVGLSLACFAALAVPDARERGIPIWPYLVACLFVGSLGALPYFIHREIAAKRARRAPRAAVAS